MGCFGARPSGPTKESQKWAYITLTDFKATSAWNSIGYVWLWGLFISTILIYAVDTFTAVNLLIFNKWSSQVKPAIPFDYSKWIFAGCIIFSWVLWAFEWARAIRVIKRGGVAESYMDPLAVELQSMRPQGWRRFLVFTELTKSKKGADLIAFFCYFAFKGAIRVLLAEGPRQVINTMTLIAVVKADFVTDKPGTDPGIVLFWHNLQKMYNANHLQAIIIFLMMYSLLIWVFSIICLGSAAILYIVFLWHHIPSSDRGLSSFCRRKIDKRLERIVEAKVKAAIADEEAKRRKAEEKEWKKADKKGRIGADAMSRPGTPKPDFNRQPTLPQLGNLDLEKGDNANFMPPLQRQGTMESMSTLPPYASRPGTRNDSSASMQPFNGGRPPPMRSATQGSNWTSTSYESNAPLLANAGPAGEPMPSRPGTAFTRQDSNTQYGRPPMSRGPGSQRPYSPSPSAPPKIRGGTPDGDRDFSPMDRLDFSQTTTSTAQGGQQRDASPFGGPGSRSRSGSPANIRNGARAESPGRGGNRMATDRPGPTPLRQDTRSEFNGPPQPYRQGTSSPTGSFSRPRPPQRTTPPSGRPYGNAENGSSSSYGYEMQQNPYMKPGSGHDNKSFGYAPANPTASPPQRSMTGASDYFTPSQSYRSPPRNLTAPSASDPRETIGYSDIVADYGATTPGHSPAAWRTNF